MKRIGKFDESGFKTGMWQMYDKNNILSHITTYLNGVKNGYWESYRTDNTLAYAGYHIDDKQTGPTICFFKDGRKIRYEGILFNYMYKGIFKIYNLNGIIEKLEFYL